MIGVFDSYLSPKGFLLNDKRELFFPITFFSTRLLPHQNNSKRTFTKKLGFLAAEKKSVEHVSRHTLIGGKVEKHFLYSPKSLLR